MIKNLPNLFTLTNLFLGCCALVFIFSGNLCAAALCTVGCFIMDYADGFTARFLNVSGPLGKELDSMADMVSFGVVPGAILYYLLFQKSGCNLNAALDKSFLLPCAAAFPAFLLSAAAGLRLAKFNIDTRQSNYFLGLSTPACTVFILGLGLAFQHNQFGLGDFISNPYFLYTCIAVFSLLMVSEIPMFGMKLKPGGWRSNQVTFIGAALGVAILVFFKAIGLSLCILLYILGSVLFLKKETA